MEKENSVSQADFKKLVAERDQYKLKMSMLVKRAGEGDNVSHVSTSTPEYSPPCLARVHS